MFFDNDNAPAGSDVVCASTSRSGFTMIEMMISMSIIVTIASIVLLGSNTFAGRSGIRVRASEIAEFIRFAQERSASSEILDKTASEPTEGFQIVRLKVRDGILQSMRLEKAQGPFTSFSGDTGNPFNIARQSDVPGGREVILRPQEEFLVDVCFIDTDTSASFEFNRVSIKHGPSSCSTDSPTYMLCSEPNPKAPDFDPDDVLNNNFDIHFSIEQPTREPHVNLIGVGDNESYPYMEMGVRPNGTRSRISDTYEGVRVVLINLDGLKRSIDVYKTGLVSTQSETNTFGCSSPVSDDPATPGVPRGPGCRETFVLSGAGASCILRDTLSGGTSGMCAPGTTGTCSYTCSAGFWGMPSSNTCTPPPPPPPPPPPCASLSIRSENGRNCLLSPAPSGRTSGICEGDSEGTCSYTCNDGVWGTPFTNTCSPPAPSCAATSVRGINGGNCILARTPFGRIAGRCESGNGSCSYTCNDGVWGAPVNNTCFPPGPPPCGGTQYWLNRSLHGDCDTLLSIKRTLEGSATGALDWNRNTPISEWSGVRVREGNVAELILSNYDLTGTIPPQIGNIQNLRRLWLSHNRLTGTIPDSLSRLNWYGQSSGIHLEGNRLQGLIPTGLQHHCTRINNQFEPSQSIYVSGRHYKLQHSCTCWSRQYCTYYTNCRWNRNHCLNRP